MLRSGRSKLRCKLSLEDSNLEYLLAQDLEGAGYSQGLRRSSRSKFAIPYPCSLPVLKVIGLVFMLCYLARYVFRSNEEVGMDEQLRWKIAPSGRKWNATLDAFSNATLSIPPGRPVQASSLHNPPRIDKIDLSTRLANLENQFPDEDLNRDADTDAHDTRQTYGLSRWPPLISHIPGFSTRQHEEYSAETADVLFCSTTPCKILLPVWARPLIPSQQMIQMRRLIQIAKSLNRTLVLPNVGQASSGSGEVLLGVGTCHRYPFGRYFDVAKLLVARSQTDDGHSLKSIIPNQPFSEWIKYRPVHPSAQVVLIDSSPSNDTQSAFFATGGAEFRMDEQMEESRGRHKNCLSSRASKLKFGNRPPFLVSPRKRAGTEVDFGSMPTGEADGTTTDAEYIEGILAFLSGKASTSNKASCDASGIESCTISGQTSELDDPDVLVVEWDLGPAEASSGFSNQGDNKGNSLFGYSARLHMLATLILSTLQRPLVVLRAKAASSSSFDTTLAYDYVDQVNLGSLPAESEELLRSLRLNLRTKEGHPIETHPEIYEEATVDPSTDDSTMNTIVATDPVEELGTLWLDHHLAGGPWRARLTSTAVSADYTDHDLREPEAESSAFLIEAHNVGLPGEVTKNFRIVDILSTISLLESRLASFTEQGILEDNITLHILEGIIEENADRVLIVGSEDNKEH